MTSFRDPVARDRAWARYYSRKGLRGVVERKVRSVPNTYRVANYLIRVARHRAAELVSSTLVKC